VSSTNLPLTQDAPPVPAPVTSPVEPSSVEPSQAVAAESAPAPEEPIRPDEVAAAAVDLAREAAEDVAEPNTVGAHLGVSVDEGGLTMHSFACTARGYRGWQWAVTIAHVPGAETVSVCDAVLLPGPESILAPTWVPWSDRLAPGDLGAGDDLPYRPDDPYLVPGYTVTDPEDPDEVLFWELGLGRERVVGREGLQAAADRWQRGSHGPTSDIAIQASAMCASCAYFVPLSGLLRQHFGACANEWSPADGSVVTTDFGCGAHSETDLELPAPEPLPEHIVDETVIERVIVDRSRPEPEPGLESDPEPDSEHAEMIEAVLVESPSEDVIQIESPDGNAEVEATTDDMVMVEPLDTDSVDTDSVNTASVDPEPVDPEPVDPEPVDVESGDDVEPLDAEPVQPEAAQPEAPPAP
jgi:hypothetical protein